jgi:voltage-gated potassium channel Kch
VRALPLADPGPLARPARRSFALRAAAFALLAGLVAALVLRTGSTASAAQPSVGATTVVVLDLSGSIGASASKTIVRTLRTVADQGGNAGLVLFSDQAEEAVPPTAPARLLRSYERLFRVRGSLPVLQNPWSSDFSDGTNIGQGLAAARAALRRAGIRRARVVLVSDLADSVGDLTLLRRVLGAFAADPSIRLHVAAVPGVDPSAIAIYRSAIGRRGLAIGRPPAPGGAVTRSIVPVAVALVLAAAALLAFVVHELANAPLAWRVRQT